MDNGNDFEKKEENLNNGVSETDTQPQSTYGENGGEKSNGTENTGGTRVYYSNPDAGYGSSVYEKPKKKGNGAMVAVVCISVVVCLLLSWLAYMLGSSLSSNNDVPTIPNGVTDTDGETKADSEQGDDTVAVTDSDVTLPYSEDPTPTMNTKEVVAKTKNSVVEIRTEAVSTDVFFGQYVTEGAGSGVIISEDGFIATNYHVIEGATNIKVYLRSGEEYTATLWGYNIKNDLAVVKIEAKGLEIATFGNSDNLVEGEDVIAIGNPLGLLGGTVTKGIISSLKREVEIDNRKMTLLQTDASVSPGNSGGGLFNASAELIGIVNAKSSGDAVGDIGYAIPSNIAYPILQDIIKNQTKSQNARLGIEINRYSLSITKIEEGSDAEAAGLQVGDQIIRIGDTQVTSYEQFRTLFESYYVGDTVDFVIVRNREAKTVSVTFTAYGE